MPDGDDSPTRVPRRDVAGDRESVVAETFPRERPVALSRRVAVSAVVERGARILGQSARNGRKDSAVKSCRM
jgi:hypothetical protein